MAKNMVWLSLVGWLLIACQPQVVYVEVTPEEIPPTVPTAMPQPPEPLAVPVTRVVVQEVTRVVTEEVVVEVTRAPLGTAERPIQLLFPPKYATVLISSRGQVLADALAAATGMVFTVGIADSERVLVELLCAAPRDTMAILSPLAYALAHEACGVQVINTAVSADGRTWQTGMIVTRRDSGLATLADLADKSWGVPDLHSLHNYLYFRAMLQEAGIAPGEIVPLQGDNSAMLALYNREVDFATGTYIPPILPYEEREWVYGQDSPEIWRAIGIPPTRSPIGYVLVLAEPEFGGYRLRDARSGIFDIQPDIYTTTRIISLSAQIPNEAVVLGAQFPLALARQITAFLGEFGDTEACAASLCAADFYAWAGVAPTDDTFYEPIRFTVSSLGLSAEEVWQLAQLTGSR